MVNNTNLIEMIGPEFGTVSCFEYITTSTINLGADIDKVSVFTF